MRYRVSSRRGGRTEYVTDASFDDEGRVTRITMVDCLGGGHGYNGVKAEALRAHLTRHGTIAKVIEV